MSGKTQRVTLKGQAREIVGKVYDFMKSEAIKNYAAKLTDARWRTAQAVQVSESTVSRILKARRESSTKKIQEDPSTQTHTNDSAGESGDTQMLVIVKTEEDEDDASSLYCSSTYSCTTQTSPRPEEAIAWDQMPGPSDYPEVSKLKSQLEEQSTVIQKQAEKIEALDREVNRLQVRNQYLEELLKESGIPYDV